MPCLCAAGSGIAFLLRGRVGLYEKQLPTRFDTPIHQGDFFYGVLSRLTVHETLKNADAPPPDPVAHDARLPELLKHMARFPHAHFPVVDDEQRYLGIIPTHVVHKIVASQGIVDHLKARDLMVPRSVVYPWERLDKVLQLMAREGVDEVVVLTRGEDGDRVMGILTRADILKAYEKRLFGASDTEPARGTS